MKKTFFKFPIIFHMKNVISLHWGDAVESISRFFNRK